MSSNMAPYGYFDWAQFAVEAPRSSVFVSFRRPASRLVRPPGPAVLHYRIDFLNPSLRHSPPPSFSTTRPPSVPLSLPPASPSPPLMASPCRASALSSYRYLLRAVRSTFAGDSHAVQAGREEARRQFESHRGESDAGEVQRRVAEAREAADFLTGSVLQARVNDKGNYGE